jgi:hypothetical protein
MYEKITDQNPIFEADDAGGWGDDDEMVGVSVAYNNNLGGLRDEMVYGTLWNDTYSSICGAYGSSAGGATWTDYTNNPIINHTGNPDDPHEKKACEPDIVHNITDTYRKEAYNDGSYYYIAFAAYNTSATWCICIAYSDAFDAAWTVKHAIFNGSDTTWADEVRSPVIWKGLGSADFFMAFAGYHTVDMVWKIGFASANNLLGPWTEMYIFPCLNESAWGWDEAGVIPNDIWATPDNFFLTYGGWDANGECRVGVAYNGDENQTETPNLWNWTKWAGVTTLGDTGAMPSVEIVRSCTRGRR